MCDYGDYQYISHATVRNRKPRRCDSCTNLFPAGEIMTRSVGKTEGDFGVTYGCQTCIFAMEQKEGSRLHLCWNWSHDSHPADLQESSYNYIRYCLENGETPTETGLEGAMAQHADAEDV